ncbi:SRPBCC family protein [Streptomyces sp. HNM0663]|uniref:SRPBCC family protein n=1 Tax=Streptomyces chengmaiensis TaxID=3040919 RepID=A0ABT6HKS0_9ACTN|nr:SRPBCC family protein [Streptomyces chengmaiensis]MDH2388900.1 SRPBCC family protein [Streptomyces chengmaiensis]
MTVFRLTRATTLSAEKAWRRVTDWRAHAARVPLTSVTGVVSGGAAAGPPSSGQRAVFTEGTVFTVRTGVGRVGVDDPMEVVCWTPPAAGRPGRCRLVKRGNVVKGWAEIEVLPTRAGPDAGCVVVWTEELSLRPLPRLLDPLVARVGRVVFGRALDGALRSPAEDN